MTDARPPHSRRLLIVLGILFFGPLLAAVMLYFVFPQWQPTAKVNHGVLVDPAQPLPLIDLVDASGAPRDAGVLRGRWSYVYLGSAACEQACRDKLYQIRQIRTLLNEKRQRVQRVYVAPDAQALAQAQQALAADHPDLLFVTAAPATLQTLRSFFGAHDEQALYLTDPNGNWLMWYAGDADSPGILKDIQRLLRMSQIG